MKRLSLNSKTRRGLILLWMLNFCVGAIVSAQVSDTTPDKEKDAPQPTAEMLTAHVLILDPDGQPIEEAIVSPDGLRTPVSPGSWYGWPEKKAGPLPKISTNKEGIAEVRYPKYIFEKAETSTLCLSVRHPDFVEVWSDDRNVADDPAEIKLERGFRIALSAVNGQSGEKIKTDLYAVLSSHNSQPWKLSGNGMLVSPVFTAGPNQLRVLQIVDGQPILWSERIDVDPGDDSRVLLKDVPLSPGVRVEGKLDDTVPRPVVNGHVAANIHRLPKKAGERDATWRWSDKAVIEEDGTFVFDSLPRDEVLQMIAVCDDYNSAKPPKADVLKHFPNGVRMFDSPFSLGQLAALRGNIVEPTIAMEQATSIEVTVLSPTEKPVSGAYVYLAPNQYWFGGGSQMLGAAHSWAEILVDARHNPEKEFDRSSNRFLATTNEQGIAIVKNLPATKAERLLIVHDKFEMAIIDNDRKTHVELKADQMNKTTIKLQAKGVDAIGETEPDDADVDK